MFEIGDLVKLVEEGAVISHLKHSEKIVGIVKEIDRKAMWSYKGIELDLVKVFWTPLGQEEIIVESFLQKITKGT